MHLVSIGGSDAGISAALRAREVDPACDVTVVLADRYPNYSICGIPYYLAGDVRSWQALAHRTRADLEAAGIRLLTDTRVTRLDTVRHRVEALDAHGAPLSLAYDRLVVATGAGPARAGIEGAEGQDALGAKDGVHVLHTMGDMFALGRDLERRAVRRAAIVGAGYVGLEMAEALTRRGIRVTQIQRGPEVLRTFDPDLGLLIRGELQAHGVEVRTSTSVHRLARDGEPGAGRLRALGGGGFHVSADLVLLVVGVRPRTRLLAGAGATLGAGGAVRVDERMRTGLPDVFAAGDGVTTRHRLLGETYLPLGTTAHKQGRIAGENAVGGDASFAGVLGTQVVKVFDLVAARTGLREDEARRAGLDARSVTATPDDHKAYYPTAHPISIRLTGERASGRLLGAQLVGRYGTEVAKRADVLATAIHAGLTVPELLELDLAYTPPLAAPWDAVQATAQAW